MAKINLANELLKHNDVEVIEYLSSTMNGVVKNYKMAIENKYSDLLFAQLGDVLMVATTLQAMKKRNDERVAQVENS